MRNNVLFLCSYYPNRLRSGGNFIERHALSVAQYASVSVLTLEPDDLNNQPYELVYTEEHSEQLKVVRAYYNRNCVEIPVLKSIIRFSRFMKAAWQGYLLLKRKTGKPDIVHLNVVRPLGIFALFLKQYEKLPFVLTEHSTAYLDNNKEGMSFLEKKLTSRVLKAAKMIMPVSVILKNAMIKRFNIADSKFQVVSNVVSSNVFFQAEVPVFNEKIRFLHISNMKPFKNVEGILRALYQLAQIRQDFELHIIGDGDALSAIKNLVKKLNLEDFIVFHPQKSEEDIADQMRLMDCFILFSHYETASMVVMESLCCGLPVIGTKVGVVPEVVEDRKNGILINPTDEKALVDACLTMMTNIKVFKNPINFRNINIRFSANSIGKQYNDIYKKLVTT
ncbi:MAG: glycosyltransferase family 4 protein [Saprospiraceae bacterium]|nr:glycosyltransferase family 4 protein [Saprospiraceae bacterium]